MSTSKWKMVYDLCDDDGNGRLTVPELCHKLSKLGLPLGDEEIEEMFIDVDHDGDGCIGIDEFVGIMMQRPTPA